MKLQDLPVPYDLAGHYFLFLFFLRRKLAGLYIATHCCYALFFTTQTIVTIDAQFVIALLLIVYVQRQIIKKLTYITAA